MLITQEQFNELKVADKIPLECETCHIVFYSSKRSFLSKHRPFKGNFCGKKRCKVILATETLICSQCKTPFPRSTNRVNRFQRKLGNQPFCSLSCCATYNNQHKTKGNNVSKLEKWLQEQLTVSYPNIQFQFNHRDAIKAELDIYLPDFKLAFELNGIFHYEPVFGQKSLKQRQNNDQRKMLACAEQGISLCVIDTSKQKMFKPSTSIIYLDIIKDIINKKN